MPCTGALASQLPGSCRCLLCSLLKVGLSWCQQIRWAGSLKEHGDVCVCAHTPMHVLKGMLPVPPQEFRRPSMYLPQAFPISLPAKSGLHSHTPSSELWFAVVSGNPPGRSESPRPRTITHGGDHGGEQAVRLGASAGRGKATN